MYTRLLDLRGNPVDGMIVRDADGAHIPADLMNSDWRAYQAWRDAGGTPAERGRPSPPAGDIPTRQR